MLILNNVILISTLVINMQYRIHILLEQFVTEDFTFLCLKETWSVCDPCMQMSPKG